MSRFVLTLIAPRPTPLNAALVTAAAGRLAGDIRWLAPGEAADILCDAPPNPAAIAELLDGGRLDAVTQPVAGRRKRLLVADMDSTIVTSETLDELAAHAGLKDAIAAITARSMNGEVDFRAALEQRVGLLAGLKLTALEATWRTTEIMPGAHELVATMRAHGAICALVSGGFTFFTSRVASLLGFDHHRANTLLDDGTVLTGKLGLPVLDRQGKRAALADLAARHGLDFDATMAVGDGANDLDMLRIAGIGVAYHAKPIVAREARTRIDHADLRALLFIQGYRPARDGGPVWVG